MHGGVLSTEGQGSERPAPAEGWAFRIADRPTLVLAAALAVALTAILYLLERRIDFYIAEEGFLWYGVTQTAHGGVPLRDFYAYDPGRYVWAAACERLLGLGDGLLALRFSLAILQAIGLFCGLLAASRAVANRWWLGLVGLLLVLWMLPRNKVVEPALLMMAVLAAVLLIERPTLRRHAAAGGFVGLAAFFGKNHGLYLLLVFLVLIPFVWFAGEPRETRTPHELARRLLAWGCGILLGLTPLWVMFLAAPGFFGAYLDSIRFFLIQGQTNFPLPVSWPWRAAQHARLYGDAAHLLALGLGLMLMPLVCGWAALAALSLRGDDLRRRALSTACGFVGVVYLHHVFSRADFHHLMPASPPFLLAIVALLAALPAGLPAGRLRRLSVAGGVLLLAGLTFLLAVRTRPLYADLATRGTADAFRPLEARGEILWLNPQEAVLLHRIQRIVSSRMLAGESLLIAPDQPGLYAFLGRPSPVWDIYAIWPDRGGLDERMLREVQRNEVHWALVRDMPTLDEHEELRFSHSRPRVWKFLTTEFERIQPRTLQLPHNMILLHRIGSPEASPPDLEARLSHPRRHAATNPWRPSGRNR
jgi:hypothetical protein